MNKPVLLGSSTAVSEQHGFARTKCGCELCRAPCRHMPGSLDVVDLERLCPPGQDLMSWAEVHLRALTNKPVPTLVPARGVDGACHWLFEGLCLVHDQAPYSCAFFDMHMSEEEVTRRSAATMEARRDDASRAGLYHKVWLHLCRRGLIGAPGDRTALANEMQELGRRLFLDRLAAGVSGQSLVSDKVDAVQKKADAAVAE